MLQQHRMPRSNLSQVKRLSVMLPLLSSPNMPAAHQSPPHFRVRPQATCMSSMEAELACAAPCRRG